MPCNDKMGNGVMGRGGGVGLEGEMKDLEGREKAFGVFLSGNS